MTNKKRAKKTEQQEINVNLSDLVRVGMKLMPQLIPIAQQIANDLNQGKPLLAEGSHQLLEVKKKRTPKKVAKKKATKKKAKKKLDYRHDYCKCGNVKTKEAKVCRSCLYKKKK